MKYLTTYRIFENKEQLLDIKDILTDLTDEGLSVDIDKLNSITTRITISGTSSHGGRVKGSFDLNLAIGPIKRLISYLEHEGIGYGIKCNSYHSNVTLQQLINQPLPPYYISIIMQPF